jgi:hypothetical protein
MMSPVLTDFDPIDADCLEADPLRQQSRRRPSSDVQEQHAPSQHVPQFDPKLRNKHIRSHVMKKRPSRNNLMSKPSKMSTSLPSLTEVPSDAGKVMEALEGSRSHSNRHSPTPSEESRDAVKLHALNAMRDVVHKQQETLQVMASQNHQYRRKLGAAETTHHSLQQDQTGQKSVINQLQMEKDSFEAEALFLREEMQTIRQELEMLRSAINAPTVTAPTPVSAPVIYREDKQGYNHETDGARRSDARDPDEDRDVATNYWKMEWDTSMKKHDYDELSSNPSVKQKKYFGSHEDYREPSEASLTARTSGTTSRSSASPHPPDPPEESYKSSRKNNKDKDKKKNQEMHEEDIEQVRRLLKLYGQHDQKEGASVMSQRSKSSELGSERSFPSRGSDPRGETSCGTGRPY